MYLHREWQRNWRQGRTSAEPTSGSISTDADFFVDKITYLKPWSWNDLVKPATGLKRFTSKDSHLYTNRIRKSLPTNRQVPFHDHVTTDGIASSYLLSNPSFSKTLRRVIFNNLFNLQEHLLCHRRIPILEWDKTDEDEGFSPVPVSPLYARPYLGIESEIFLIKLPIRAIIEPMPQLFARQLSSLDSCRRHSGDFFKAIGMPKEGLRVWPLSTRRASPQSKSSITYPTVPCS
jgi:hypothetical protein